jgi:hypothetical protein
MGKNFEPILNHVGVLVRSVEKSAAKLQKLGLAVGNVEKWPGEGTLEVYVGDPAYRGRLLLMEPYTEGAYQRAMNKRGPGLHHTAIDVNDIEGFVDSLSGSGWLLHPKSVKTILELRTAWLSRPGIPTLIEVQQREKHSEQMAASTFITQIGIHLDLDDRRLIAALSCAEVVATGNDHCHINIGSMRLSLNDLIA